MNRLIMWLKRFILLGTISIVSLVVCILLLSLGLRLYSSQYIYDSPSDLPVVYTGIIPGASVKPNGTLSHITYDRTMSAVEAYSMGKISRVLISGDHGQKEYDEVNTIRRFILKKSVLPADVFMDHAGFDTYATMTRATKVFLVEDAVIFTQRYHLYRAVFIARMKGIKAYGCVSDKRTYLDIERYKKREMLANVKALYEVVFDISPKYLGDEIPISGDSRRSWD